MKLNNKFVAIVPVYNMGPYIGNCLKSIIDQDYPDIGIIVCDDMSTDNTADVINEYVEVAAETERDVIFTKNDKKLYPAGNIYESAMNHIGDDSVMGIVDGDDYLCKSYAVSRMMKEYDNEDVWMAWSQHRLASGGTDTGSNVAGLSKPLPDDNTIQTRQYWSVSHFRTNRKFLFNHLNRADLLDYKNAEQYSPVCGDAAYLYPLVEMCGRARTSFIREVLYHYRDNLSTNEHRGKYNEAVEYGLRLKTLKPYKQL